LRRLVAILVVGLLAVSCGSGDGAAAPTAPPGGVLLRFEDGVVAAVEVVSDANGRAAGLMNREALGSDAGMLFLFPSANDGPFWMWHTLVPLSIAYLRWEGRSFKVVAVKEMTPCGRSQERCSEASRRYDPGTPYNAALEMNHGWFRRNGLNVGDVAETEGVLPKPS
jgi:hypothetical protein